jgi:hypothetical protein
MCDLANLIYFGDRTTAPVAIFTDELKVPWWMTHLLQGSPYLTVLALQGPQEYIEEVVKRHLFKAQSEHLHFKFNVLVLAYQSLKTIGNLFDFKQALQSFSLLVMDEKMSPLGRYYYSNTKIARIKFHKDAREDVAAIPGAKN